MPFLPMPFRIARRVAAALGLAALAGFGQAAASRAALADVVIYEHWHFEGRSIRVGGVVPNLTSYGFNDRASSIRVLDGTWEICEHANFQGRCMVIDRDVWDMTRLGFNDQISSIRPVRPRGTRNWGGPGWGK